MGMQQSSRFCSRCQESTLHSKRTLGLELTGFWIILAIFTCGLALLLLPFMLLIHICSANALPRCQSCGKANGMLSFLFKRRQSNRPKSVATHVVTHYHYIANGPVMLVPLSPPQTSVPPSPQVVPAARKTGTVGWHLLKRIRTVSVAFFYCLVSSVRREWLSLNECYKELPEWLQPVVWGLGISIPCVAVLFMVRAMMGQ